LSDAPFTATDPETLDEGDILANVPFAVWGDGAWRVKSVRGIVTSHGCACEDYARAVAAGRSSQARKIRLHVAPIRAITGQPEDKLAQIRDGKVWRFFYVYGDGGQTLQDQVVDLDDEQAIPATVLWELPRVARLAPWQWRALLMHITVNRWGRSPEDIFGHDRAEELRTR
jgi:hypothetical protein